MNSSRRPKDSVVRPARLPFGLNCWIRGAKAGVSPTNTAFAHPCGSAERCFQRGCRYLVGDTQDNLAVLTPRCGALERCTEVLKREYGVNLRHQLGQ